MIYSNPSDEVLRSAHLVTLYDPRVPGWNVVLIDVVSLGNIQRHVWNVVDIPVDSTSPDAIQRWRDWVQQVRMVKPDDLSQYNQPGSN
jgi:hypothetical protein